MPDFSISRQFFLCLLTRLTPMPLSLFCSISRSHGQMLYFRIEFSASHFQSSFLHCTYTSKDNIRSTCCGMFMFQVFYPLWSPNYFPVCNLTLFRSGHCSLSVQAQPCTEQYQCICLQMDCWIILIAPFAQQFFAPSFAAIVPDIVLTIFFIEFVFSFRYWERYSIG